MYSRLSTFVLFLMLGNFAISADWPKWRGPAENGISPETDWTPDIEGIIWKTKIGTGFSSMAVAGGKVYTMGHENGKELVSCLEASSGKVVWQHTYAAKLLPNLHEGGPSATPTVYAGKVFTLGKDGKAFCLDAASGKVEWAVDFLKLSSLRRPPEWGFSGSPYFVDDQTVVFEAGENIAVDAKSGKERWRTETFKPAYGTPISFEHGGVRLVASLKTEGLVVHRGDNGKSVAFQPWKTSFSTNANTPIYHEGKLFVSTGYNRGCGLFRLEPGGLTKVYETKAMSNHMNNSVLLDGHLYGFDGTAHRGPATQFGCVEFGTGESVWKEGGLGCGSVIAANGHLIILTERGELLISKASPQGLDPLTREQVLGGRCWTPPALSDGHVYCRNAAGDLVCVRLGK